MSGNRKFRTFASRIPGVRPFLEVRFRAAYFIAPIAASKNLGTWAKCAGATRVEAVDVVGREVYQVSRSGICYSSSMKTLETGVTCGTGTIRSDRGERAEAARCKR